VTTQPLSRRVPVDTEVTFVATAAGYPVPTMHWEVSVNQGASWAALSGETSPTLVVTATADRDGEQVRAVFTNALGSATTNAATLTLAAFTDDPPVAGVTPPRAVHVTELRSRIDALRTRFGLSAFAWTDATLEAGATPVRRVHVSELRTALDAAYTAAGQDLPTYTDPDLTAGVTVVKAVHVTELRAAVVVLDRLEARPHQGVGVNTLTDPAVRYYHLDALGSVRAVTDAAGALVSSHDFLPFGEEWAPPSSPDTRLFTGKERDAESGLDYFGARYYRADLGRFTSIDPASDIERSLPDPERWHRYSYVRNNPLRFVDPDGREVRAFTEYLATRVVGFPWALFFPRHSFMTVTSDVGNYRIELTGSGMEMVPLQPAEAPSLNDKDLMRGRLDVRSSIVTRPADSPDGDFTFEHRILARAAILSLHPPAYDPETASCNGFAAWLVKSSGGEIRMPYNAFFPNTKVFEQQFQKNLSAIISVAVTGLGFSF
jgi:RHS repeat-associated protein